LHKYGSSAHAQHTQACMHHFLPAKKQTFTRTESGAFTSLQAHKHARMLDMADILPEAADLTLSLQH
jgi:hypothetical protein